MMRPLRALVALALLHTVACAGPAQTVAEEDGPFVRRAFPAGLFKRKAINYSGYRTGHDPDLDLYPSEAQIQEDLELLVRGGWGLIRLFDCGVHAERTLKVIRDRKLDLKVFLGVWIAGPRDKHGEKNSEQIEKAAAFVKQYPDIIVAVSVGNETLDDWSSVRTPPHELADYIRQMRRRTTLPVTTDDAWQPWALATVGKTSYADVIQVLREVDFAAVHAYAFAEAFYETWDWKQASVPESERGAAMMAAAVARTKENIRAVRAVLLERGLGDMPLVIGETGWKSTTMHDKNAKPDDAIEVHFAHPVNQKLFYDAIMSWTYGEDRDDSSPLATFYFEAFDEPWKDKYGDDGWGLFDVERRAKYVIWDLFPDRKPKDAPAYGAADAVYFRGDADTQAAPAAPQAAPAPAPAPAPPPAPKPAKP